MKDLFSDLEPTKEPEKTIEQPKEKRFLEVKELSRHGLETFRKKYFVEFLNGFYRIYY